MSVSLKELSTSLRVLCADTVEHAKSGHPGIALGMADVMTVLFSKHLKFDIENPSWSDRDRFVLSAGHGCVLLYALFYLMRAPSMTLVELQSFRKLGSLTPGHPELGITPGVDISTGPLGQGFANAVGMALAERKLASRFGSDLVDHHTYVVVGDGCLMEGVVHEAASLAGHLKLSKLIVLFDSNHISIDGSTDLTISEDTALRFRAYGWNVQDINGHDHVDIDRALEIAKKSDRPSLIICQTTIGCGAPTLQGSAAVHGAPLGQKEVELMREKLGWNYPAFCFPESIVSSWAMVGRQGQAERVLWQNVYNLAGWEVQSLFSNAMTNQLSGAWVDVLEEYKQNAIHFPKKTSPREVSGELIARLCRISKELMGGSADLSSSNQCISNSSFAVSSEDYSGNYIHYGVREHAMAAMMNGMAVHGGFVPFGGTYLAFSDYSRPAIRLSALMKQRVIYVMTHDSVLGPGEDGPTHQPVEHLASLRAMPGLHVFRPADAIETLESWRFALKYQGPSIIALARQSVEALPQTQASSALVERGGYIISASYELLPAKITLIATGSEVSLAIAVQKHFESLDISVVVVSMPCWTLFDKQSEHYQKSIVSRDSFRVSIEAGSAMGWAKYTGDEGLNISIDTFGHSGSPSELAQHFSFTIQGVINKIEEALALKNGRRVLSSICA